MFEMLASVCIFNQWEHRPVIYWFIRARRAQCDIWQGGCFCDGISLNVRNEKVKRQLQIEAEF